MSQTLKTQTLKTRELKRQRRKHGATMGLVVACVLLIILAIVGAFQLSVYLSGSQEMKNSVDAGALNVAKRSVQIKVPVQPGFEDVADSMQMYSLANINRVWGKAYLI